MSDRAFDMDAMTEPDATVETDAPSSMSVSIARSRAPTDLDTDVDVVLEYSVDADSDVVRVLRVRSDIEAPDIDRGLFVEVAEDAEG